MSALLIALALFSAWLFLIIYFQRTGRLDRWNATRVLGAIIMLRSHRGLGLLEKISRPRRFWQLWGEVCLWMCRFASLFIVALLLLSLYASITQPPVLESPNPLTLVALPGLNPLIPLGWGLLAFIVALVMHEFAHGIQARAHGMRIRSFGLLMLGPVPLGAFAEPETNELIHAPRRERQRLFAAGPGINLQMAFLCIILLGVVALSLEPTVEGVYARGVIENQPAHEAGLQPFDLIIAIDENSTPDLSTFRSILHEKRAGDSIILQVERSNGSSDTIKTTLVDRYEWSLENGVSDDELSSLDIHEGDAFLGVSGLSNPTAGVDRLAYAFTMENATFGQRLALFSAQPLTILVTPNPWANDGHALLPQEEEMLQAGSGPLSFMGTTALIISIHALFWLIWTNLVLGLFNLIPLIPFDGGHMFKDGLHDFIERLRRIGKKTGWWDWHALRSERIVKSGVKWIGVVIAISLIVPIFVLYVG